MPKNRTNLSGSVNAGVVGDKPLDRAQQAWDVQRLFKNSRDMGRFGEEIGPVAQDNNGQRGIFTSQRFNLTPAIFVSHIDIQKNEVYVCGQRGSQRFRPGFWYEDSVVFARQHAEQHSAHCRILVHQNDFLFHRQKKPLWLVAGVSRATGCGGSPQNSLKSHRHGLIPAEPAKHSRTNFGLAKLHLFSGNRAR